MGLLAAGCKPSFTAPDGSKVTLDKGGVSSVETDKGKVTVSGNGKDAQVNFQGKDGSTATFGGTVTEADLGVAFYPGSTELPGSMKTSEKGKTSAMASRQTTDPASKVIDFYTAALGKPESTFSSGDNAIASWSKPKKVSLSATREKDKTTIIITTESN